MVVQGRGRRIERSASAAGGELPLHGHVNPKKPVLGRQLLWHNAHDYWDSDMNITVQRKWFTPRSTVGEMHLNGAFFCYTLEPRADQAQGKPYCIPAGQYSVALAFSGRFKMITPHVMDVPGFSEIEIHPGNFPKDTEGCCLVGSVREIDFVGNSRATFSKLMEQLQAGVINISYVDAALAAGQP
jgi:hypothetical protein